ncbi:MAG: hypothetical protein DI556_16950 [Rhodovulum sulfidophilum]|uniref:Cytochrome C oxidase subunit IV n=1 Tax=Rhodovulum sulfidophilum TaxID=35806 RepID=A0A2W5N371_RHOSU|nr:MAG: hypothetical protein DI556_16950 [Rhodovulum sulfidophilum]
MTDAILDGPAGHLPPPAPAAAHAEGRHHPLRLYFVVWGWLFVLSACSYLVDYFGVQGAPRWTLILIFMCLKAGLIVAFFMHMAWERLALVSAICLPVVAILVFVAIMTFESSYTLFSREAFFALFAGQPPFPVTAPAGQGLTADLPRLALHTLLAVVWGAVLALGFAGLIFLGDAEARRKPIVSVRFDGRATLLLCLSWFSLPLWFGFGQLSLILACAASILLCATYAASYRAARPA